MSESNWLEQELRIHMGPVPAPAHLKPGTARSAAGPARFLWPALAVLLVLISVDIVWELRKAKGGFRQGGQPTSAELTAIGPDQCDILSSDPVRIRQWVKSRSGIELELPPHSPSVRIVGAKIVNLRGSMVASVSYETDGNSGSLLVWKDGHAHTKHTVPTRSGQLVSWSQGDNLFATSGTDATARGACMLCHPEGTHGI